MTGPKTNERPGTRAQAKYVRASASKAREVLNQIRNKSYGEAVEILTFSERAISKEVAKVLQSATENAFHNDNLDPDELFVSACYADEGPTLKRIRPRARGRAAPILKRTCHITVIVDQYDEATLEAIRERSAASGRAVSGSAAQARRQRVARSRENLAEAAETEEISDEADEVEEIVDTEETIDANEAVDVDEVGDETENVAETKEAEETDKEKNDETEPDDSRREED